jgi:hypothetical protein
MESPDQMPSKTKRSPAAEKAPWFGKFEVLLARKRTQEALALLNDVIKRDLPLLDTDHEIAEDPCVAWLCRIDLLRIGASDRGFRVALPRVRTTRG